MAYGVRSVFCCCICQLTDLYTFDASLKEAEVSYNEVCEAYLQMFKELHLDIVKGNKWNLKVYKDSIPC